MENRKEKKVSVVELFYDLIFVYAISQISQIITTLNSKEMISLEALGKFFTLFLVFWGIWSYQTIYSNRFSKSTISNYIFIFINMFLVIVLSQSINYDFEKTYFSFVLCTILLCLSIGFQYILKYIENKNINIKKLCLNLSLTLFLSAIVSGVTLFLPSHLKFKVYFMSILFISLVPIVYKKSLSDVPTNFEHLTERYSLFIIILFGESIVSVAKTIAYNHISLKNILYFSIIVCLFSLYMMNYSIGLDHRKKTNGFTLMYTHLFFFISIDLMSILLEKLVHEEINRLFFIGLFYLSLSIFVLCLQLNFKEYHKLELKYNYKFGIIVAIFILTSASMSIFTKNTVEKTMIGINITIATLLFIQWLYPLNKQGIDWKKQ